VESILQSAKSEAARILADNHRVLDALRDALLEREELVGDEILDVIAAAESQIVDLR
jgi:ATP-dependent Zn protease